jgi:2-polyprenyl-6-methoxyphenol hydroxylase-like FAD-dependent oxidoreductase
MAKDHMREVKQVISTTCCIVGAGPAGALLALLLARQGIPVLLLEAHADFDRDFRGDTIHPSVLTILNEIGLAEPLLQIHHTKMSTLGFQGPAGQVNVINLAQLPGRYPYIAMISQAKFLEFITKEAQRYPEFQLVMGAQVDELIKSEGQEGKIEGVRYHAHDGLYEVRAILTVGTDGRFSRVRKLAGFEPIKTSPPMDILWFRLSRKSSDPTLTFGRFASRLIVALINRDDYWQIGYVIPKGEYQQVRAAGLEHFQQTFAAAVPELADRIGEVQAWKQVSVLSVESSYVPRWYRPGLLLLGDAAHVMSPVGGVGINYAIQDAVVASNILAGKLRYGIVELHDLARIQRSRALPTHFIQLLQSVVQQRLLAVALKSNQPFAFPAFLRFALGLPGIRVLPARIVAYGLWPVHVKSR